MAIVITDDTHYKQIANALRKGTGDTEKMIPSDMPWMVNVAIDTKYHEGYEQGKTDGIAEGKQAEYDRHWDNYQDYGNRTNYRYAFNGVGWTDELFRPKYRIVLTGNSYDFAASSKISYIDESIVDCSGVTLLQNFLSSNASEKPITVILDVSSCTRMTNTFIYSTNLETVELKNIREDCLFANAFLNCTGIVNFNCTGTIGTNLNISSASKLSGESTQNITDHLKVLTPETTQTLTVHQDVRNRMTPEQVNTIVNVKNWTLAPAESTN